MLFVTGPGFQMAQKFVESIFEQHVNWTGVSYKHDDNYKNSLTGCVAKSIPRSHLYT